MAHINAKISDDLKVMLDRVAHKNGRSRSSQIAFYLELCTNAELGTPLSQAVSNISPSAQPGDIAA